MKFLKLLSLLSIIVAMSCEQGPKTDYTISIESNTLHNGVRSYIKALDKRGRETILDSAVAQNQAITFKGSVADPEVGFLSIDGVGGSLMMFLENKDMTIDLDTINIAMSKISGSKLNDELSAFNKNFMEVRRALQPHTVAYREAMRDKDDMAMDSIKVIMEKLSLEAMYYPLNYVKDHPKSYMSLFILESQIGSSTQLDYNDYKAAYIALDTSLLSSRVGTSLKTKMEAERLKFEKNKVTAIGAKAPEFSGPTPNGNVLALSDVYVKGKYTIIDFWAAWCGPCRRENPNVVRIYNKYHDQGLEIIGVSLDGRRNQQDPKGAWVKAIETDQLNWNHISNLQYFGPIAQQYNVNSIPAMFIVDSKGVIVAKNLRGQALENKIAELLGS